MSSAEYAALEQASESRVRATVSFLASDELAGRGTPSPEFRIACAYVASRLRAAGATGLGQDGSFYLESKIEVIRSPRFGLSIKSMMGTEEATTASVLHGVAPDSPAYQFEGEIPEFQPGVIREQSFSGPAALFWSDDAEQPRSISSSAKAAARKGATALMLIAERNSEIWEQALRSQSRSRLARSRRGTTIPIVVVAQEEWLADATYSISIPANLESQETVRNVAGVLHGSDEEFVDEAIIYSAHLDHLGVSGNAEDNIYNGADDDASGVTAVLTLADVFGSLPKPPARSVVFMTFWGEEQGLLGSREYCKNPAWPLEKTVANINLEMLGRPEEEAMLKCWMTGWKQSDLGAIMAQGSRRLGVEVFEHPSYSARLYRASDNYAFVQKGVVAHSFSAGSLHADYHRPSDEWQKLNLPHMTQVIRGIFAGSLPIANAIATPAATVD